MAADKVWTTVRIGTFLSITGRGQDRRHAAACLYDTRISATGTTVEEAQRRLATRIRGDLREVPRVCRVSLWGDVEDDEVEVTLPIGRSAVTVVTPVAWVTMDERTLTAVLPRVPGGRFLLPAVGKIGRGDALRQAISAWRQRTRPDFEGEELGVQPGDRFDVLRIEVDQRWTGPLRRPLFSFLGMSGEQLDGREELAEVAEDLRGRGPTELLRDLVEAPYAATLRHRLFEDPTPTPVALIGPAGSGRTTIVHAALARQRAEEVRVERPHRHIWHLDPTRVIAGQSMIGQWQRRFEAILGTISSPPGRTGHPDTLFIDQVIPLITVGRYDGGSLTLSSMLRAWLTEARTPCVLEATPEQWQRLE